MLPLAGRAIPADHASLAEALRSGFRSYGVNPRDAQVTGGAWPHVAEIAIDLTGGEATRALRAPSECEKTGAHLEIDTFNLQAHPLHIENTPVTIDAHFSGAKAAFVRDKKGALFLRLERAQSGKVDVAIVHADLEKALQRVASEAAGKHGAEVKSATLELETPSRRTLLFRAAITAKVFIMKTTVRVRGRVDFDEALNARISGLAAEGEGMLSSLVESGLRPHFAKLEQEPFAIGSLVAGGLRVSDVSVSAGATLRLNATFTSAAA